MIHITATISGIDIVLLIAIIATNTDVALEI